MNYLLQLLLAKPPANPFTSFDGRTRKGSARLGQFKTQGGAR